MHSDEVGRVLYGEKYNVSFNKNFKFEIVEI